MIVLGVCLGVLGAYIGTSVLLTRFPLLLHKKKKQAFVCKHISHRGGAGENLENTITAFKHAIEHGTEMLEIDVNLTADGQVVVSHDNELVRTTGHGSMISDFAYEELPCLLESLDVTFDYGKTVTCCNEDRKIPLLRTLFEQFPTIPMNIDLKVYNEELIDKTIDLIKEFKREDMVVLGNFSSKTVNYVHKKAPEIPILFSIQRTISLVVMFYLGILPFVPLKEDFLEIPYPRLILRHPTAFQSYRTIIKIADWLLMSPVLFRHLQRRGLQVYIFVLNTDDDFEYCLNKLGATGVMTDYPTKLSAFLKRQADETEPILPSKASD
ncbi:lysophospholipase D GDPD1-like [Hydractinia symbiolongicarpus]|uniref:lysophospholipase D GDPD1-like n=1 Tax=Hydractinia symbiolongicarpus TaxID=13093 RepID=UPI0025519FB9|nr:lysophospholipase D GDPD1-like [Hydractinia symbiolongicarpus]